MLTEIEKKILGAVQEPLDICEQPFEVMARLLGCRPEQFFSTIGDLKSRGYIRRYSATVNYAALGRTTALAAASVPQEKLKEAVTAVNSLACVSHHYLRKHTFNLWFTLQGESLPEIESTLFGLNEQTGVQFYSLPTRRIFKLEVRFCPDGPSEKDFEEGKSPHPESMPSPVSLTDTEKKVLRLLQEDFPITEEPFEVLSQKSGIRNLKEIAEKLTAQKVIRRIAAVLDYRKLGYTANVMACFALPQEKIEPVAYALSARAAVSHCYQRMTFTGWPYNLFAMIHAGSLKNVERFVSGIAEDYPIGQWVLLPTEKELKKAPVLYNGQ